MNEDEFLGLYWKNYILLEKEFSETLEYITLDVDNYNVYSARYIKLLLQIGSEIDINAKLLCSQYNAQSRAENINHYRTEITGNEVDFCNTKVNIIQHCNLSSFMPWESWSQGNNPDWWTAYNKVKHERFRTGNIGGNTKEYYKYDQYTKQNVRHTALVKAVEVLTSERSQSCCVERNYVRRLYDYFTLSEDVSQNKIEAQKINVSYITNWEKLHDSFLETKRPEDLMVCFLSGPEPDNDFQELINLGVLPQNIWGFESNNQAYKKAIATYDQGKYPQPRILKQNIETFFQQTPKKFDIVYIDACGSVPSAQHALRCVSTICQNHRLNSPGVIITSFVFIEYQIF